MKYIFFRFTLIIGILLYVVSGFSQDMNYKDRTEFYDPAQVREVRLSYEQSDWQSTLDSLRLLGDGLITASAYIDGKEYKEVGVRYRRSAAFKIGSTRNSLEVILDHKNAKQHHNGVKHIILSQALRDPSMVREVLGYEIARKYMPAPMANYARLFINDKLDGLFVNVEAIDEEFLKHHFGSSSNYLIYATPTNGDEVINGCKRNTHASLEYDDGGLKCYKNNYVLKSDKGWTSLMELSKVITNEPEEAGKVLHVDRTLWMLAFNNAIVNLSSYSGKHSQNYFLYQDDMGRYNPIIWDLNLAFGSYKNTGVGSDLDLKGLQSMDPLLHVDNNNKPLISGLLSVPEYKRIYIDHIRTIIDENFENDWYKNRAEELQTIMKGAFYNDPNKYYKPEDFDKSLMQTVGTRSMIPGIVELMSKRGRFLRKHPEVAVLPPDITDVGIEEREKYSPNKVETFKVSARVDRFPTRVHLFYRFDKSEDYTAVVMVDDGKHNDKEAGDNIFGVEITPSSKLNKMEYYILAENERAANFHPSHYMFMPEVVTLKELN